MNVASTNPQIADSIVLLPAVGGSEVESNDLDEGGGGLATDAIDLNNVEISSCLQWIYTIMWNVNLGTE